MIGLLGLVLLYVRDSFRPREQLRAEMLRHQLNVLRRRTPHFVLAGEVCPHQSFTKERVLGEEMNQRMVETRRQVSLSSLERVERGEQVSPHLLDKIGRALGYDDVYFTAAREPIAKETVLNDFVETYGDLEAIADGKLELLDRPSDKFVAI